jgi:TetR/AcrR family transcriptional regulator
MTVTTERLAGEAENADVRARIVHSALDLFAAKGYAATSLREIAEAARTTKPMIYYYFRSKEGLYLSTLGDRLQAFANAIDRATRPDDTPVEKLRAFADAYLRYFQSQEPHIAFVVREVFGLGADITAQFGCYLEERVFSRLKVILQEGVQAGVFRECDIDACSVAVMGILNMFILRRVFGNAPLDREAAVAQVDCYLEGLRRHAPETAASA